MQRGGPNRSIASRSHGRVLSTVQWMPKTYSSPNSLSRTLPQAATEASASPQVARPASLTSTGQPWPRSQRCARGVRAADRAPSRPELHRPALWRRRRAARRPAARACRRRGRAEGGGRRLTGLSARHRRLQHGAKACCDGGEASIVAVDLVVPLVAADRAARIDQIDLGLAGSPATRPSIAYSSSISSPMMPRAAVAPRSRARCIGAPSHWSRSA